MKNLNLILLLATFCFALGCNSPKIKNKESLLPWNTKTITIKYRNYSDKVFYTEKWVLRFRTKNDSIIYSWPMLGMYSKKGKCDPVGKLYEKNRVEFCSYNLACIPDDYDSYCYMIKRFSRSLSRVHIPVTRMSSYSKIKPYELHNVQARLRPVKKEDYKGFNSKTKAIFVYEANWISYLTNSGLQFQIEFEIPLFGNQSVEVEKLIHFTGCYDKTKPDVLKKDPGVKIKTIPDMQSGPYDYKIIKTKR